MNGPKWPPPAPIGRRWAKCGQCNGRGEWGSGECRECDGTGAVLPGSPGAAADTDEIARRAGR